MKYLSPFDWLLSVWLIVWKYQGIKGHYGLLSSPKNTIATTQEGIWWVPLIQGQVPSLSEEALSGSQDLFSFETGLQSKHLLHRGSHCGSVSIPLVVTHFPFGHRKLKECLFHDHQKSVPQCFFKCCANDLWRLPHSAVTWCLQQLHAHFLRSCKTFAEVRRKGKSVYSLVSLGLSLRYWRYSLSRIETD